MKSELKGKSYEQRDLDTWMEMTVLWKIPMCLFMSLFPADQRKAGGGRGRSKVARKTSSGVQQTPEIPKRDRVKMVSGWDHCICPFPLIYKLVKSYFVACQVLFYELKSHGTKIHYCIPSITSMSMRVHTQTQSTAGEREVILQG